MIPAALTEWLLRFDLFVIWYFLALNGGYIILCTVSLFLIQRHMRFAEWIEDGPLFRSGLAPAISVIVPAHDEEATIVDSIQSLLALEYPKFEIVIVNDGSRDRTLRVLKEAFNLYLSPRAPSGSIATAPVRGVYRSRTHPNLLVVDKENHGKADALNAGINFTRNPLICAIDADSILEPDALLKVVRPFLNDPDTVAAGGVVRILNGSAVSDARVCEARLPTSHLARFQVVEYFRGFLFGRVGWAVFNALPIVSGAFGIFQRRAVLEIGGYRTDSIGEDMELVMRMHQHFRGKRIPYQISFVPDPICWTEVPEDMRTLARQRNRWQRGLIDSLWSARRMFLNPFYGVVGTVMMPFFVLFEMLGPVIEVLGWVAIVVSLALGIADVQLAILFACASILLGIILSLGSVVLEGLTYRRYPRISAVGLLMLYGVLENFGYRQLHAVWRLSGIFDLLTGRTSWGAMHRKGVDSSRAASTGSAEMARVAALIRGEGSRRRAEDRRDDEGPSSLDSKRSPAADEHSVLLRRVMQAEARLTDAEADGRRLIDRGHRAISEAWGNYVTAMDAYRRRFTTGAEWTVAPESSGPAQSEPVPDKPAPEKPVSEGAAPEEHAPAPAVAKATSGAKTTKPAGKSPSAKRSASSGPKGAAKKKGRADGAS